MTTEHTTDDVERLAQAVVRAGGSALLIHEDNTTAGEWCSISDAARSGRAFLVHPKRSLAVFDLDTDGLIDLGVELADAFGYPALWVTSGRNRHLYINAGSDAARDGVYAEAVKLGMSRDVFRTDRGVRPPLSPHRLGHEVGLVDASVDEAVEILGPPELPRHLPEWFDDVRVNGDAAARRFNGGRSGVALALASAMKTAGMKLGDYRTLMLDRRNYGGAKAHELEDTRGISSAEAFLVRTWDRAELSGTGYTDERVSEIRQAVLAYGWRGRAGGSDRAVMLALCSLADRHRTMIPTVGDRGVADEAQVSSTTAGKALSRLTEQGWLEKIPPTKRGHAAGYRLQDVAELVHLLPSPPVAGAPVAQQHVQHPAFREGSGLGKSAGLVWDVLGDVPMTRSEITTSTGKHRSTVGRAIKTLASSGLAEEVDGGWIRRGDLGTLQRIAEETGAARRADEQRAVHNLQRLANDYRNGDLIVEYPTGVGESGGSSGPEYEETSNPTPTDDDRRRIEEEHLLIR